jgi:hypothetical protein
MRLSEIPHTLFPLQPPPLWYVTNGELTVGPVVTGLLTRGVEYGRVPDYCHVRPYRGNWRALLGVREISALRRKLDAQAGAARVAEWQRALERIRDEDELCHTVTWIAMLATSAESGMFHFRSRSPRALVTRAVVGPMQKDRLGYPLPEDDLLLLAARRGKPVTGPPYGPTEDALAMRFATSRGGAGAVAMIPVFAGGSLTAMLELSRPGHAFRRQDLQTAERLVQRALYQRSN